MNKAGHLHDMFLRKALDALTQIFMAGEDSNLDEAYIFITDNKKSPFVKNIVLVASVLVESVRAATSRKEDKSDKDLT